MDSARRGPRKSSLTQSRSSVSSRSGTHPRVRSDSEPPVNQSDSGSLVKRRTQSETVNGSKACVRSSSGSTVKRSSIPRLRKSGSGPSQQTQSTRSGPHAKSGSGSLVNRQIQSTSAETRSRSSSGGKHAKVASTGSLSGNGRMHATQEVQVDGEGSGATSSRQVMDGVRFTKKVWHIAIEDALQLLGILTHRSNIEDTPTI